MQGYCQNCQKIVEVNDVVTIRLPNRSFVHRGTCSNPKCLGVIFVKIPDHEILIDQSGHKCPVEVFAGPATPKRIVNESFGQKVITKEGVRQFDAGDRIFKTVAQIKKEMSDEKVQ